MIIHDLLQWWDSIEIEVILRHTIGLEVTVMLALVLTFILWHRIISFGERRQNRRLAADIKLISQYIKGSEETSTLANRYSSRSVLLLIRLIRKLDKLKVDSIDQEARKNKVREHIFENTLRPRAEKLARSRFFVRRVLALNCYQLWTSPQDEPAVYAMMSDPVAIIRLGAARLTLKIGSDLAVDAILKFLQFEKRFVRNLIHFSAKEATNEFVQKVRGRLYVERDTYVKKLCLDLISNRLTLKTDGEKLNSFCKSEHVELRISALRALFKSHHETVALTALGEAINDPHWEVRATAARLCGKYQIAETIPLLTKATRDPDWWVRRNSSFSLAAMGVPGEEALRYLAMSTDPYAREMAELALKAKNTQTNVEAA
jgi:HEAT repeat protein